MTFKTRFSPSEQVVSPVGVEPAQQQFKKDCDINSIMARFQKTGAIDHVAAHQPRYGIANPLDYHQAMNLITQAQNMFADLPSSIRNKFKNNPALFMEFVQNPENEAEANSLGLALSDEAAAVAAERRASEASETTPESTPAGQLSGETNPPSNS